MEIKTDKNNLPTKLAENGTVSKLLDDKARQTDNVKNAIDIFSTKVALEQHGTVEKLVAEKTQELKNDAEAKRVKAETDRVYEEVRKAVAEKDKVIAEYDKIISEKRKEVEQLNADSNKAQAFFDNNKEILKFIGVRNKKSLKVMQALMFPATLIFIIVQILLFPLTFVGVTLETIVNIVGGICGAIKNNALKIITTIFVILLILGVVLTVYIYGGQLISKL